MAFAAVQVAHGIVAGAPQNNFSVAFPGNVTAGNLIIVYAGNNGTGLTDSQGNVYTALASTTDFGAGSQISISFTKASISGPCTVTVQNSMIPQQWCVGIVEYNTNPPTLDQSSGLASLGFGNGKCPTPITTTKINTLAIAAAIGTAAGGQPDTWTIDSGFTIDDHFTSVPFNAGFCIGSLNVAGSGVLVNPTFTNTHWILSIDVAEANFQGVALAPTNIVKWPPAPGYVTPRPLPWKHCKLDCDFQQDFKGVIK